MIGWQTIIPAQSPDERETADADAREVAVIAHWQVGLGGLDWIKKLVKSARAHQLLGDGCPDLYTAKAGDVLPLLFGGPPAHPGPAVIGDDYAVPANWRSRIEPNAGKLAACAPDRLLTIEAWDQS
mgnify:CR=1 FL=1|jgi:hypothetical protein